jgi:hypothetical protein
MSEKPYSDCQYHAGCQWLGPENATCSACGRPTKGSVPAVSPGDLRARIEQLEQTNSGDERASNDWRDGYQTALDDVLALLGAAQEKS